jgi:hypothetical protein
LAFQGGGDGAVVLSVDGDAVGQAFERLGVDRAMHPHPVFANPAGRRQFQSPRQGAVIGQQQQPFGVHIEPADGDRRRQFLRQPVIDGRPAFWIAAGGQPAGWFVIPPQTRRLTVGQGLAVDQYVGLGRHIQRRAIDHLTIYLDPAQGDPAFRLAARTQSGPREHLGNPVAAFRLILLIHGI